MIGGTFAHGALELTASEAVATLTLNRTGARNALNVAMWTAIPQIIGQVAEADEIRVLIIRGAGGNFASGADIAEFETTFASRDSALAYGALLEAATGAIAGLQKPVIAAIAGYCVGAGLAIALACDLRVAASNARLGAPPAKLGLMYSLADTRRLMHAVGASAAKNILFTGEFHDADKALAIGLVDEVHDPVGLIAAVSAKARLMASLSPWSIRRAKAVVRLIQGGATEETDETRGWFADAASSPDLAQGLVAFAEKREPKF
jgi:enoyl-CoA hydratase/carnithine racemase